MSQCKIHNVRFYNPQLRAIYCMALQEGNKKLALSRSDATVEIWNLDNSHFIERTIAPTMDNFSVEGLVWCNDRLFTVGLHGLLIEYCLRKTNIKARYCVTGESATCLDINRQKTHLAIGTETGYINIFTVNEDDVTFEKFLDKQEGRIVCLKFDSTGNFIVTGSIDTIRVWNVNSGHAIHKMTLGRSEAKKETIVWCLAITDDFTIFTGDSRGKLTLWDGKIGAQLESYQSHKADITSLCISKEQDSLYCAGVDPTITNYVKVNVKGGTFKWVKSIQRKIHTNDVRCMALQDKKLYSAGLEGYLVCSFHPKTLLKFPPIMQNSCAHISREARYITLRHPKHIEVWRLGDCAETKDDFRGAVDLKKEPKKLLVLQKVAQNWSDEEEGESITCCAVSDNGKWLFLSTISGVRLYQMDLGSEKPNLMKVHGLVDDQVPCSQAIFTPNNLQLITAPLGGNLNVYDLKDGEASLNETILTDTDICDNISILTTSGCGNYLIAADVESNITIWSNKAENWVKHTKLPKHKYPPTALACNPKVLNLVVIYADHKLIEYDIKKKLFTTFSKKFESTVLFKLNKQYPIRTVSFDLRKPNIILLHDDSSIIIINKDTKVSNKTDAKLPKITNRSIDQNREILEESSVYSVQKFKHLVYMDWLSKEEMVAVEVSPLNILEQLPPAFVQSTFGAK